VRLAQGFKCVKMNATEGIDWLDSPTAIRSCVERLKAVRDLGLEVGLDFHGRLHKPMAKQLAKAVEPYGPLFIEEPLLMEHPEGLRQLAGLTTVPIAFGERLYHRWDVKKFLEDATVDILQPDLAHAGGISEVKKIAAMAEAYDVAIAPHCPLGPIALAAAIQIDLCVPNFAIQEMSLGIHYNTDGHDLLTYLKNPSVFQVMDGYVNAPKGFGLGIEINEELVRSASVANKQWQSGKFFGPDGSIREW
jgi:galactonate dehydratase